MIPPLVHRAKPQLVPRRLAAMALLTLLPIASGAAEPSYSGNFRKVSR